MTRRRRPLLPEEWAARQRRQMSTGRGQANAKPVKASAVRTRTVQAPGGGLHYYGAMNVGGGTFIGASVHDDLLLPDATPTNDFANGAAATWILADGDFEVQSGGYWALRAFVSLTAVTGLESGTLRVTASTVGAIEVPLYNNGSVLFGAAQIGPAAAYPDTSTFKAEVSLSTSLVVGGCEMTLWPTGLFPELPPP